jgi:DNA anti-recombination protein RmuC
MEIDKAKLLNTIIDRSNAKLGELQQQVILLESQLQLVLEANTTLKKQLDDTVEKAKKKDNKSDY